VYLTVGVQLLTTGELTLGACRKGLAVFSGMFSEPLNLGFLSYTGV